MDINNIFNSAPIKIEDKIEETEPEKKTEKSDKEEETNKIDPDRDQKIIFIGNVPLECEKKDINNVFKEYGKIEKIWFRSVPIDNSVKMPKKAKVVLKKYTKGCKNKNCYLLFKEIESKEKAIKEKNNYILNGRHLHVTDSQRNEKNFKTTAFIGNLHYQADEEDLREFFKDCGKIDYIRIVRDKHTFEGKGFGYVKFDDRDGLIKGLAQSGMEFMDLNLRVSKAKKSTLNSKDRSETRVSVNKANYLMRKSFKRGSGGDDNKGGNRGRGGFSRGRGMNRGRGGFSRGRGMNRGRGGFSRGRGMNRGRGGFSRGRGMNRGRGGFSRGRGRVNTRGRMGNSRGGFSRGTGINRGGKKERSVGGRNGTNTEMRKKKIEKKN